MSKIAMMVTVDVEAGDVEQVRADVLAALTELMRSGVTAADAEVSTSVTDATEVSALVRQIARMDTFEDKAIRDAIQEGATDPGEIAADGHAAQADQDWMEGQSDALESLVRQARGLSGDPVSDSVQERILAHPDFQALSMGGPDESPSVG